MSFFVVPVARQYDLSGDCSMEETPGHEQEQATVRGGINIAGHDVHDVHDAQHLVRLIDVIGVCTCGVCIVLTVEFKIVVYVLQKTICLLFVACGIMFNMLRLLAIDETQLLKQQDNSRQLKTDQSLLLTLIIIQQKASAIVNIIKGDSVVLVKLFASHN